MVPVVMAAGRAGGTTMVTTSKVRITSSPHVTWGTRAGRSDAPRGLLVSWSAAGSSSSRGAVPPQRGTAQGEVEYGKVKYWKLNVCWTHVGRAEHHHAVDGPQDRWPERRKYMEFQTLWQSHTHTHTRWSVRLKETPEGDTRRRHQTLAFSARACKAGRRRGLTHAPQEEEELPGVLVEAEVDGLGVEDGADQVSFSREEPYRRRRMLKPPSTVVQMTRVQLKESYIFLEHNAAERHHCPA